MAPKLGESSKTPFHTVILLREQEIATELRKAFAERYLPEHLFYWLPASVQAWVDLCRSIEYKNASRALEVLKVAAPEVAQRSSEIRALCGLGCGEGSKDRVLLESFDPLNFIAADFSQGLIEGAADQVIDIARTVTGFKLNVFSDPHMRSLVMLAHSLGAGAALFSVLGNTLGAFNPKEFPARLRPLLEPQDRLLFDGEIFTESTLSGYDNPTNRRFAWGPLAGVGITEDDGQLEFSTEPAGDGLFAVTKHFIASRDLRINVGGELIEIRAGEKLRMSSSIKYRNESVLLGLVEAAGFEVEAKWASKDGNFVLAYAKPK
jgi:uncharacterized SAM-dependent methyltransferase